MQYKDPYKRKWYVEPDDKLVLESKNIQEPIRSSYYRYLDKPNGNITNPIGNGYCKHCGSHVSYLTDNIYERHRIYICNICGSDIGSVWS